MRALGHGLHVSNPSAGDSINLASMFRFPVFSTKAPFWQELLFPVLKPYTIDNMNSMRSKVNQDIRSCMSGLGLKLRAQERRKA